MRSALPPVDIDAAALAGFDETIDVRAPSEFHADHVPGAVNLPVLDDDERARVGTLHARVSPFDARKAGAALVARNIAAHLENALADRPRGWRPLVYCWRGGKRSGAFAHVLREIGWEAATLAGGYKAYRRWVGAELGRLPGRLEFRVVHGPTGAGKSRLLGALERAGAQVLDLERLAAHRGSVLGVLPDRAQPSQKLFESRLRLELAHFDAARPVYVEAESRKIGELQVPEALIARMRAAECVRLDTTPAARVALLLDEYDHFLVDPAALGMQLDHLESLHGARRIREWKALAHAGRWQEFVERLLFEHYDPAYEKSARRHYVRLGGARTLALERTDEAGFDALARALVAAGRETVPA